MSPDMLLSQMFVNFLGERGERDNKPEPDPPQTRLSLQIRLLSLHSFSTETANPKKAPLSHLASKQRQSTSTLTIYAPMIYTTPCVMFLMRADTLRGQVG